MKQNILILAWLPMTLFAQSTDCFIPKQNANIPTDKYQKIIQRIPKLCKIIQSDSNKHNVTEAHLNLATQYALLSADKTLIFNHLNIGIDLDTLLACKVINVFNQNSSRPFYVATDSVAWKHICDLCTIYRAKQPKRIYKNLNLTLAKQLDSIEKDDQKIRLLVDKLSPDSEQYKLLWQEQRRLDKINLAKIETIIQQYGYPGRSLVGDSLYNVAFLVIQHSNLQTCEKYLPILKKAVQTHDFDKTSLFLLVDRIHTSKYNMQLWGSQSFWNEQKKDYESFPIDNSELGIAIKKEIDDL